MNLHVVAKSESNVLELVTALGSTSLLASLIKQPRHQQAHNGKHDKEFSQCESGTCRWG